MMFNVIDLHRNVHEVLMVRVNIEVVEDDPTPMPDYQNHGPPPPAIRAVRLPEGRRPRDWLLGHLQKNMIAGFLEGAVRAWRRGLMVRWFQLSQCFSSTMMIQRTCSILCFRIVR